MKRFVEDVHVGERIPPFVVEKLGGNFDHLLGSFTRSENHFRKTSAQSAVRIHLRESKVDHRGGLKCLQYFVASNATRSELLQQLNCFRRGHRAKMPQVGPPVTWESARGKA